MKSEFKASKMAGRDSRFLRRPFALQRGSGQIVEEASFVGQWHEPAIQLMEPRSSCRPLGLLYGAGLKPCSYGQRSNSNPDEFRNSFRVGRELR